MITLYGFPASNYFGLVKHALLLKAVTFDEVVTYPTDPDYLIKSPMGKVPCIGTEHGYLSESFAIVDYLENAFPETPILPTSPYERAKAIEIMRIAELYVELSGRRFLPEILMGTPKSEENRFFMLPVLKKAFKNLEKMGQFGPYILGDSCSLADVVVRYNLKTGFTAGKKIFEMDFLEKTPKLKAWWDLMNNDPISQAVDKQAQDSIPEFTSYLQKAYATKK